MTEFEPLLGKQVRPPAEHMPDTSRSPNPPAQTRIIVPGAKIAYFELGRSAAGHVGFRS